MDCIYRKVQSRCYADVRNVERLGGQKESVVGGVQKGLVVSQRILQRRVHVKECKRVHVRLNHCGDEFLRAFASIWCLHVIVMGEMEFLCIHVASHVH